jgi:hypothetical protein
MWWIMENKVSEEFFENSLHLTKNFIHNYLINSLNGLI